MKNVEIRYCKVWASFLPRAARVAELIKKELGINAELKEGDRGEFSVLVNDKVVAKKGMLFFPKDRKVLTAVRQALAW